LERSTKVTLDIPNIVVVRGRINLEPVTAPIQQQYQEKKQVQPKVCQDHFPLYISREFANHPAVDSKVAQV
jgi:hypothetical protein